jgi:hypothetical protein
MSYLIDCQGYYERGTWKNVEKVMAYFYTIS